MRAHFRPVPAEITIFEERVRKNRKVGYGPPRATEPEYFQSGHVPARPEDGKPTAKSVCPNSSEKSKFWILNIGESSFLGHFWAYFCPGGPTREAKKVVIPPGTSAATRSETVLWVGVRAERARLWLRAPKMCTFGDFRQNSGFSQEITLFTKNAKKCVASITNGQAVECEARAPSPHRQHNVRQHHKSI